jgi:hypothetical protein
MKKVCAFTLALLVCSCFINTESVGGSGGVLLKTEDTGRYRIVVLRTSNSGSAGPNEVILLDKDTGRTWTLQSKELTKGWVLMPREDKPAD